MQLDWKSNWHPPEAARFPHSIFQPGNESSPVTKIILKRRSWALVLDHPMLFADHRLKILSSWFWSTANNKDTTRPAAPWCPCWSPWSPWTCWPAPPTSPEVQLSNLLIDNWAFLKSHYSEGNLLLQPCLNYNCQTYATTEWYWKIFRCVGISL